MKMPSTTSGRFWAYVGTTIGLGASLAGNIAAAFLDGAKPTAVEYGLAAVAPMAVFLAIEIGSRNPWKNESWGPTLRKVMMWVVGPAAAVFSFIHLVELSLDGKATVVWDGDHHVHAVALINWTVAVLAPVMIDGLMVGSAAALLLPKSRTTVIEHGNRGHALPAPASTAALEALEVRLAEQAALLETQGRDLANLRARKRPVPKGPATTAPQVQETLALESGERPESAQAAWEAEIAAGRIVTGKMVQVWLREIDKRDVNENAARAQVSRWARARAEARV